MSQQFEHELARLKRDFTVHATACFEQLERAGEFLRSREDALGRRVIDEDDRVDEEEIQIEAECVRLMTLHHPVAADMRLLVTMLKLNYDLERISDHASNIAWLAGRIFRRDGYVPEDLLVLADRVVHNGRSVFQAFLDQDLDGARAVLRRDADVDALDRRVRQDVHATLSDHGEVSSALHVFRISRELERVGDHIGNMAEDVIYLVTGEIVRHSAVAAAGGQAAPGPSRR